MDIVYIVRKLAKSNKWQSLFSYAKELKIKLFKDEDLSEIQVTFLKYLNFYSTLYLDIALGDIEERVLENNIYEDSYMLYRNKNTSKSETKKDNETKNNIQWVFQRPK